MGYKVDFKQLLVVKKELRKLRKFRRPNNVYKYIKTLSKYAFKTLVMISKNKIFI